MAGDEQGEQLVAHLGVAHRAAVLVAGGDQHREDVVALLEVLGRAALGDLAVDQLVDPVDAAAEGRDAAHPLGADQEDRAEQPRVGGQVEELAQRLAQLVHARSPSWTPKTVSRMISSVIACIRGRSL